MAWQLDNTLTPAGAVAGAVGQRPRLQGGDRSLRLEDMEHLAAQSTLLEAEDLIRHWLAGVESASVSQTTSRGAGGEGKGAIKTATGVYSRENTNAEAEDFLSTVDWVSGDVGQSTKDVLRGLLSKELKCEVSHRQPVAKKHDPRVAIEMRHKQVKQRREDRERKRREELERRRRVEVAEKEARALVREEERRAKAREEQEERMIQQQMKALRKEVRERERLTKQLVLEQSLIAEEPPTAGEDGDTCRAVMEAEKFVESERRRVATRMELVRQLEEAEVKETKENVKLLHQCFQNWWGQVMRGRGKLAKAVAVRDWRLVLRVWKAWRRFVKDRRDGRARDQLARWLQREKRLTDAAVGHHTSRLLWRSLWAWHKVTRQAKAERVQEAERQAHREKMASLIQAAMTRAEQQQRNAVESTTPLSPSQRSITTHQGSQHTSSHRPAPPAAATCEHRVLQPLDTSSSTPAQTQSEKTNEVKRKKDSVHQKDVLPEREDENCVQQKREPPEKPSLRSSDRSSGPVWRNARKQLDDILSQVEAPPTATPTAPMSRPHRPKPKPVTKHLNMTAGMERRSAEIAERKLAREQRREAKMRERAEELAREEEEQRKMEAAMKEAKLKQKREERQLAKQREAEKLERQKLLADKMTKAVSHYHTAQLRWRGMAPWKKFVEVMKASYLEANRLREKALTREVWSRWQRIVEERERERTAIAIAHHHKALLKKGLVAWVKFRQLGIELESLAELHRPRLLLRRVFRGWAEFVREERREEWEKMARARRFRQRQVQCSVLRAWRGYVPVAKEEREREKRREQLRRKVASWLTDYQPLKDSTDVAEQ